MRYLSSRLEFSETVAYATKSGSAKAWKDFKPVSGSVTFAPNETTKKVTVKTKQDGGDERKEKFFLTATAGGVTSKGAARITDDD